MKLCLPLPRPHSHLPMRMVTCSYSIPLFGCRQAQFHHCQYIVYNSDCTWLGFATLAVVDLNAASPKSSAAGLRPTHRAVAAAAVHTTRLMSGAESALNTQRWLPRVPPLLSESFLHAPATWYQYPGFCVHFATLCNRYKAQNSAASCLPCKSCDDLKTKTKMTTKRRVKQR